MKRTIEYIIIEDDEDVCNNKHHKPSVEEEEEEDIIDLNDMPGTQIVPRPQNIEHRDDWMLYMRYNHAIGFSTIVSAERGAFTSVDLPAGVCLGRMPTQQEDSASASRYVLHRSGGDQNQQEIVDAPYPEHGNWLRCINQSDLSNSSNVGITETGHFVTLCPVQAWAELFCEQINRV
ncbi:hypothetical protein [Medusavirus stheno T3]|uniref:Uncharacterized protein n=1 Tax=Medusavirus stheno T3 TaxID=3069717 RepID=A0A7S7YF04_9VIRU|nr:hypothetical protein QKU73_gp184 [Acanthamoeba castellanii medusavirus]QPB44591.1 hypothetical protein [Medusavirus stheno T3]